MTKIITANELRERRNTYCEGGIIAFNKAIEYNLENYPDETSLNLYFDQWGYEWGDIQFILDAGYKVKRNGSCLWWEVSW